MIILANDPSIREWGWVIAKIANKRCRILDTGCIKTDAEHKKRRIRKSDDMVRRLDEITDRLLEIKNEYKVSWMLSELPHGSQSASAAKSLGAVTGLVCGFAKTQSIPVDWYSEGDCKKHVLGKKSATKEQMIERMSEIYKTDWVQGVKYKDAAVADALAVLHIGRAKSQALLFHA